MNEFSEKSNVALYMVSTFILLYMISTFILLNNRYLYAKTEIFVCENGESLPEEFVEIAYYKDLNSVDRLHHRVSIF